LTGQIRGMRSWVCQDRWVADLSGTALAWAITFAGIIAGMPRHKKAFGGLSMTDAELMAAALIGLERQRSELEEKMAELRRQIGAGAGRRPGRPARVSAEVDSGAVPPNKRTMSAAARRRIAAAQRKRWAAIKKAEAAPKPAPAPKKRRISAAGRKRVIEATKKRWAEFLAKKAVAAKKSAKTVGKKASAKKEG